MIVFAFLKVVLGFGNFYRQEQACMLPAGDCVSAIAAALFQQFTVQFFQILHLGDWNQVMSQDKGLKQEMAVLYVHDSPRVHREVLS